MNFSLSDFNISFVLSVAWEILAGNCTTKLNEILNKFLKRLELSVVIGGQACL